MEIRFNLRFIMLPRLSDSFIAKRITAAIRLSWPLIDEDLWNYDYRLSYLSMRSYTIRRFSLTRLLYSIDNLHLYV